MIPRATARVGRLSGLSLSRLIPRSVYYSQSIRLGDCVITGHFIFNRCWVRLPHADGQGVKRG